MVTLVFGTRPESVKLGPIAAELRALGVPFKVIASGQHTDLLSGTPAESDLKPDAQLNIRTTGDLDQWSNAVEGRLRDALRELRSTWVVVQGDTQTAGLTAGIASELGLPIVHVEAGVRSGCLTDPYPEEGIRSRISQLATLHCAATDHARKNLRKEGIWGSHVTVTGNPVVSALSRYSDAKPSPALPRILVTIHRRETILRDDFPALAAHLMETMAGIPEVTFLWPLHPHTKSKLGMQGVPGNLQIVPPQSYLAFTRLLATSQGILTDSGGCTEEACTLGVPTAILRKHHDRPEAVAVGLAKRFDPTPEGITASVQWLNRPHARIPNPVYGTPRSAANIATLLSHLDY